MAIDFTTAGGQVRLLVADVDETRLILTDEMINGFLSRYGLEATAGAGTFKRGPVNRAAADALDTIATSEALVLKVLGTVDGLKTDGAALADSLRKRAETLRKQADQDDSTADGEAGSFFGVVPFDQCPPRHEAEEYPTWV